MYITNNKNKRKKKYVMGNAESPFTVFHHKVYGN